MSYAMVSQNHGVGIEVHHALQRELGDEPVEGLIATYAGTGPDGLCVISVWDSKGHADRFTAEQLVPTLQRLGLKPDPTRRSVLEIDLEDIRVG
ncbi:MAG: hypothetical protein H0V05_04690 [Euzebyaceae bacterium]|nr:hypothetical protein [Euzebyaceae bacterium]